MIVLLDFRLNPITKDADAPRRDIEHVFKVIEKATEMTPTRLEYLFTWYLGKPTLMFSPPKFIETWEPCNTASASEMLAAALKEIAKSSRELHLLEAMLKGV